MKRRSFLGAAAVAIGAAAPTLSFQEEKSGLKITGVRLVRTRSLKPSPSYTPAPGSWSTGRVEVANPMSIYPKYKATRSLFGGKVRGFTVEIETNKGIKGYGRGGAGGGEIVTDHWRNFC